ncbi:MAG: hypothetical protein QF464_19365, partial [Myxococcota bacterium]|nr:hypothetical protein [Myxococcota bacterium]
DLGMTGESLALLAARYDADHAEFGISHAMPVAVDILGLLARYPGLEAVYPLMQAFDMCAAFHPRRDKRPVPESVDPGDDVDAAGDRLLALVEGEEVAQAEALLRGALARGWDRATVEPWFYRANAHHFIGFGHGLIYTTKAFDLLEVVGWEHAAEILPGVLVSIINQTREERLPEWRWFRVRLAALEPRLDALYGQARSNRSSDTGSLVSTLVDGAREEAFDAITDAVERGVSLVAIVDALSVASSERLMRFDHGIDADHTIQNGWLTVTHILTYVNAVRSALSRFDSPDLLRYLYFAARQVQHHEALDLAPEARLGDRGSVRDTLGACRGLVEGAVRSGDAQQALDALAGFVHAGGTVATLRPFCEDLALNDARVEPIRVAHLLKTGVAAFEEHEALASAGPPGALRPIQSFLRFAASPMRERNVQARSYEAIRFIVHGKVPRTLA